MGMDLVQVSKVEIPRPEEIILMNSRGADQSIERFCGNPLSLMLWITNAFLPERHRGILGLPRHEIVLWCRIQDARQLEDRRPNVDIVVNIVS